MRGREYLDADEARQHRRHFKQERAIDDSILDAYGLLELANYMTQGDAECGDSWNTRDDAGRDSRPLRQ